jgi:hypothetical protein
MFITHSVTMWLKFCNDTSRVTGLNVLRQQSSELVTAGGFMNWTPVTERVS